jgi:hypothetical protein
MNAKTIALTIVFTAVAISLNAVRIPAIFYPGNSFQVSQIPIVVAFLLFGIKIGVLVGVLNLAGGLFLFPLGEAGYIVYPMDFVSLLPMFLGMYFAIRFVANADGLGRFAFSGKSAIAMTLGAIAFRGGIMPLVDYGLVNHILIPLVFGFQRPEPAIVALVPAFVLYNVLVAFYTVSAAYLITTRVGRDLKIENGIFRTASER